MGTLHQGNQQSSTGMPNLNAVVQTPMTLNALVTQNQQLFRNMRQIADTSKISECSVFTILHESLRMGKLFSKWVPCLPTPDQKQQCVEDLERCSELFKQGTKDFLRWYVTVNGTWIRQYTPETKRSSVQWTAAGESYLKRSKTQQLAGKVMASVF